MSKTCDCAVDAPAASSDATHWSSENSIWLDQFEIRHTAPRLWYLPCYQADPAMIHAQVAFTVVGESATELGNDSDPTDGFARPGCLGTKLPCLPVWEGVFESGDGAKATQQPQPSRDEEREG